ncbi:regulatory protein RecX [Longispora sp. K20-0274]|uniref:regulatory protein RecX n=1 Tax=Longispora sp. K20-0274 TaxID=3088255 RepID=UPI00399C380E
MEPRAREPRSRESNPREPRAREPRTRDSRPREPRPRKTPEERAQAALDRAEAARLEIAKNPEQAARAICLRLLNDRPRTRSELAAALAKRGVPEEAAAAVLDRYDEVGLIDDAAFARAWVSTRHHGRGLARRALGQELRRKGVDSDTIGEALEELDPETEEATAREFVARRLRSVTGPPEAVLRKVVGALARKGYPPGLAFRVVKEALEQAGQEADFDPDAMEDSHLGDI